jgi:hypothetical protein
MKFIKNYYSQCCKTDVYISDFGLICNNCKKHIYNTIDKKYYLKTQKLIKIKNQNK